MSSTLDYFKRKGSPVAGIATATGGPVLVLRISGNNLDFLRNLFDSDLPSPGTFQLKKIVGSDSQLLDQALVLNFKSPNSFTGEDVVEIHTHGVPSLTQEIFERLKDLGVEKALPGEFSFRAVMNEKMTLEQAEALNFVLKADSLPSKQSSKLIALRKIPNDVEELMKRLLSDLQKARGRVEAAIDFPEAEVEQAVEIASAKKILLEALESLISFQNAYRNFRKSYQIPLVAIVGSPNAGKSTLLNILLGGEKALVSPLPGTTRDLVEGELELPNSKKVRLIDTAGIRSHLSEKSAHDELEEAGILKAFDALEDAAAVIWVKNLSKREEDPRISQKIQSLNVPVVEVYSHLDENPKASAENAFSLINSDRKALKAFIFRGLEKAFSNSLDSSCENSHSLWLSERQYRELGLAEGLVRSALGSLEGERPMELVGDDLRDAEKTLLGVLGQELGEEYISQIFSQFCLGK